MFLLGAAASSAALADAPAEAVRAALAAGESGRLDDAAAAASDLLAAHPTDARVLDLNGWVRERQGDAVAAVEWYQRAAAADPRWTGPLVRIARVRRSQNRWDDAIAACDRALAMDSEDLGALRCKGWVLVRAKRAAEGEPLLARAVQRSPDDGEARADHAEALSALGRWTEAVAAATEALRLGGDRLRALSVRAAANGRLGAVDAVIEDVRAAAAADAKSARAGVSSLASAVRTARKAGRIERPPLDAYRVHAELVRGLRFKVAVPVSFQPPSAAEAPGGGGSLGLKRLGIHGGRAPVDAAAESKRRSSSLGWYLPSEKRIALVGAERDDESREATIVHELVHALQDQHHDLAALRQRAAAPARPGVQDDDRDLALRCVIEGDATYCERLWTLWASADDEPLGNLTLSLSAAAMLEMDPVSLTDPVGRIRPLVPGSPTPDHWAELLVTGPYVFGFGFAAIAGAADREAIFRDPAMSMEQVLHPARYSRRDVPTTVSIEDVRPPAGWTRTEARVLGELGVRTVLSARRVGWTDAKRAATGWDGDLLLTFSRADGASAIAWGTTWDTADDAGDFAARMVTACTNDRPARMHIRIPAPESPGLSAAFELPDGRGEGRILQRGCEVFFVEGFDADGCDALLARMAEVPVHRDR